MAWFLPQAYVEEEQEWQEGIDNSRHRRSTRHTSSIKKTQAPAQALSLPDAVLCYCHCMQHMLQVHLFPWLLHLRKARPPCAELPTGVLRTGSAGRPAAHRWCERGCGGCGTLHLAGTCRRVRRCWARLSQVCECLIKAFVNEALGTSIHMSCSLHGIAGRWRPGPMQRKPTHHRSAGLARQSSGNACPCSRLLP